MELRKKIFHIVCLGMLLYQAWGTINLPVYGSASYALRDGIRGVIGIGGFFTFFTGPMQLAFLKRFSLVETTVVMSETKKFKVTLPINTPQNSRLLMACLTEKGMHHFIDNHGRLLLDKYPLAQKIQTKVQTADLTTYRKGDEVHESFHETFRHRSR